MSKGRGICTMRSALVGALAVALLAVMACSLAGCGSSGGSAASSASSQSSAASAAPASDMAISVTLKQDVTSAEAVDTPLQFSEEQIDVKAPAGATALEVLQATGREVQTEGSGSAEQVTAIGGLVNGDANGKWTFQVNGEEQSGSPADVVLNDGDTLTWVFVN